MNNINRSQLVKIPSIYSAAELFKTPKLQFAFIKINDLCNAKCSFCDVWRKQINFAKGINWNTIIHELGELGTKNVNVHGGEAFLSKAFFPMLEGAPKSIAFSITTNGILLNNFYDRLFNTNIKRIYVSIDHYDSKLNSQSRRIKKLENNLFPILSRIKSNKPEVELVVNHVVSSYNIDTIDLMIYKMLDIGINSLNLIPIKDAPHLYVTKAQISSFYKKINTLLLNSTITKNYFMNGIYKIFGEESAWEACTKGEYKTDIKKACIIPATTLFIDGPTGNVYPCDTTLYRKNNEDYIMGNVLNDSLKDIWFGDKFNTFRNKMYPKITCSCINGCDPANVIL